jgi:hypothetical protein
MNAEPGQMVPLPAGPEAACWKWTVFGGLWLSEWHLAAHAGVFPSFGRNPPVGWARKRIGKCLTRLMLPEPADQPQNMVE